MPEDGRFFSLPDVPARCRALLDHSSTLLVEAGAGSGKTALMAGRVALMLAHGICPRDIVAITFTEAAAAELLERIERFVAQLSGGTISRELSLALPDGLSAEQATAIGAAADALDEITCTTIHGFCQQLLKPYPVEADLDPGAAIIDPAAATLAYQDLLKEWLSVRFGRTRDGEGLGRIPHIAPPEGEDLFAELLAGDPDQVVRLITGTAEFLRSKRTARAPAGPFAAARLRALSEAITGFAAWHADCGITEPATGAIITNLRRCQGLVDEALSASSMTGRQLTRLLLHEPPDCRHSKEPRFNKWGHKGKWQNAAKDAGHAKARGDQLSAAAQDLYDRCSEAYRSFVEHIAAVAVDRFVTEFDGLRKLYANYKRQAALLDFDDLLHQARDLLAQNDVVRRALSRRYPRILVDEFQDTDPLQAEILWLLCGDGEAGTPWIERPLRPGSLFLVGDPKQAIYRFRNADVDTYLQAKDAIQTREADAVLKITANFRSVRPIIEFVNDRFQTVLSEQEGQPGFTALAATRPADPERHAVACFDVTIDDRHKNAHGGLRSDLVRREEAGAVAELVTQLIGAYPVWDKHLNAMRACRPGDIALLAPTGSSLWIYERALDRLDIPVASQAGKGFFRRQEVQELIALARAIADRRDTLALGALLRGPLVGLTEEELADIIAALPAADTGPAPRIHLWTDRAAISHPVLSRTLEVFQALARKARRSTPYQLIAEAIEELNVRPILSARYRLGAERALANVELFLEMARPFDGRGLLAFADAMRRNWEEAEDQVEGRPDAKEEAISIVTIHSSKGLEWPIVIPINSPTELSEETGFLHRRADDTVHFKLLGHPTADYDQVKSDEDEQVRRERVRLWYVATTRACDLLLLPRQSERNKKDWMSLLDLRLQDVPLFERPAAAAAPSVPPEPARNGQDDKTWQNEAATIAGSRRCITWRSPSRHEEPAGEDCVPNATVFADPAQLAEQLPSASDVATVSRTIQGGRERGLVVHKLLEEVLTGETPDNAAALETRAGALLAQLAIPEAAGPEEGPHAPELAAAVVRALSLPAIAALRPRLRPEMTVFAAQAEGKQTSYVGGVADALAYDASGFVEAVIDWKTDVDPSSRQVDLYRAQLRDYLDATGATRGLLVFVSSGLVLAVEGRAAPMAA
jgi:exodeoxyribonuclease-5